MELSIKMFFLKLIVILVITPGGGYLLLRVAESLEKEWKSNDRRKKWVAMCGVFFLLACIGGWLR